MIRRRSLMKKLNDESGHAYGYGAGSLIAIVLIVLLLVWLL